MKNLVVSIQSLVSTYAASVADVALEDHDTDLATQFGHDLAGLVSEDVAVVRKTIRRLMAEGYTMMMLREFQQIQDWDLANEPYTITVVKNYGTCEPILVLVADEISY